MVFNLDKKRMLLSLVTIRISLAALIDVVCMYSVKGPLGTCVLSSRNLFLSTLDGSCIVKTESNFSVGPDLNSVAQGKHSPEGLLNVL